MKKRLSILFLLTCVTSVIAFAQLSGTKQEDVVDQDNVFLDGIVSDYYTGENLSGVSIQAVADGKLVASGTSDGKGSYKMVLEFDKEYKITFSRAGLISKTIIMNTSGVPESKKHKVPDMGAEITLFKPNECIKSEMLNAPVGKAIYYVDRNEMDWDMNYSMDKLAALNKMLDDCAKQVEKQEQDYVAAMKVADQAFAKQDWENAKAGYQKALSIYADKPEPKDRLKLIETELTKKAEAEKQRAEEKARAEAEAKAKAEKEAAAKKEEQERLAKEKAEATALAKAEAEKTELAKAEAAAKKAEQERLAKEQKEAEAKTAQETALKAQQEKEEAIKKKEEEKLIAQKEAEKQAALAEQAKLEKEAATNKKEEVVAKKEEVVATNNAKKEEKEKLLAQKEAEKRAAEETKAKEAKETAAKKEEQERLAKEQAANLAKKAEEERAENKVVLLEEKEEVKEQLAVQVIEEKKAPIKGSSTIKIKSTNKGRHLYEKPNKTGKGKGARPMKHIVL